MKTESQPTYEASSLLRPLVHIPAREWRGWLQCFDLIPQMFAAPPLPGDLAGL